MRAAQVLLGDIGHVANNTCFQGMQTMPQGQEEMHPRAALMRTMPETTQTVLGLTNNARAAHSRPNSGYHQEICGEEDRSRSDGRYRPASLPARAK